jgi:AraC-like DNA-binding protein
MWSSVTSAFGEPCAFQQAMRAEGGLHFAVTHQGRFQARLSQVTLDRLHISNIKESLPRIAFVRIPDDTVLIALSLASNSSQIWGGVRLHANELVTCGPGTNVHTRTDGSCHWGSIRFPTKDIAHYSQALTGEALTVPDSVSLWRPPAPAFRLLRDLHSDATRTTQAGSDVLAVSEVAHGLEQQVIHAVIECLSGSLPARKTADSETHRREDLMIRFEDLLAKLPGDDMRVAEVSLALGVSDRFLRRCCDVQLGMSPLNYLKLRRLQLARCALRHAAADSLTVSAAAMRHGFRNPGRFAAEYRQLYGEAPSYTLRHGPHRLMPELAPRRRSGKRSVRPTT